MKPNNERPLRQRLREAGLPSSGSESVLPPPPENSPGASYLLVLLACLTLLAPSAAEAQPVHVSNLDQPLLADNLSIVNLTGNSFTTGGESSDGFRLDSVVIHFRSRANLVTVGIYTEGSDGNPGTQVGGDLNQVDFATSGQIAYTASGIILNGDTTYFVGLDRTNTSSLPPNARKTLSDAEDADSADGWSIGNGIITIPYGRSNWVWFTETFNFQVNATRLPFFTTQGTFAVAENEKWVGFAVAKDANPEDDVIYNIGGGEDGHLFFINYSGAFGFLEPFLPDYENPGDADRDNVYEVVIRAISGRGDRRRTATQAITVRVFDVGETTDPGGPTPTPDDTGGGGGGTGGGTSPGPAQSSDAALSGLGISDLSIDFDPGKETYAAYAPRGAGRVTVTPTARHRGAEITLNGQRTQSGESVSIDLEEEETRIEITVTAEDRTVRTYTVTVTTSCPEERRVLESFYEETGGESWDDNENWNSPEPLGQWYGVRTNDEGKVISLRLAGNGLTGEIPEDILCLSQLRELALWENDGLGGEIPQELALAVERAALRDVARALSLNVEWFNDYEDPYEFADWHGGVTTNNDGRVTELDFTGEGIRGEIPRSVFELQRLEEIRLGCGVSLGEDAPGGVRVETPDGCPEETAETGGGGCALGSVDSSASGLLLLALVVFAALAGRNRRFPGNLNRVA